MIEQGGAIVATIGNWTVGQINARLSVLRRTREQYGIQAMNALTVDALTRYERKAARVSEKIWALEEELESRG